MHESYSLLLIVIFLALIFDFINGFHDSANAIATSVSTRVLSPKTAVLMAAALNMIGAFSGTAVAKTVGVGLVQTASITQITVISALLAAIVWDLITWYFGLPTSSSHAILSGIVGAAVATSGTGIVIMKGVEKVLMGLVLSPLIGFVLSLFLMFFLTWMFRRSTPTSVTKIFSRLQIMSAAYMAFSHGSNDAQKTMGIITMALVSYYNLSDFHVPAWVIVTCCNRDGVWHCRRWLENYQDPRGQACTPQAHSRIRRRNCSGNRYRGCIKNRPSALNNPCDFLDNNGGRCIKKALRSQMGNRGEYRDCMDIDDSRVCDTRMGYM